jgi:hypothetical protein
MTHTDACSRTLTTTDPDDQPIEVTCQLPAGHHGHHRRGHYPDHVWTWDDEDHT